MNERQYYRAYSNLIKKHEKISYQIAYRGLKKAYQQASQTYLNQPETPIDLLVDEADTLNILIAIYNSVGMATASMVLASLPKQKQSLLVLETKAKKPKQYQQTLDQNDVVNYWKQEFLRFTQSKDCAKKVTGITKTTKEQIRKIIEQGVKEQLSYQQVGKLILEEADSIDTKKRALLIARTENAVGSNLGAMYAAKSSGLVLYKKWIARSGDNRTRDAHAGMIDSTPIPIDQHFIVGGEKMMQPGDSSLGAKAHNICNCRCTVGFIPASEVLQQGINRTKPVIPAPLKQPTLFDKPIKIEDKNVFRPANSIEEATKYAVDNGFAETVNYKWTKDVDVANQVNKTLFDLTQQFGMRKLLTIGESPKSTRALMSASYRSLNINHRIFKSIKTANMTYQKYEAGYSEIIEKNIKFLQSRPQSLATRRQLAKTYNQQKYKRYTVHYEETTYIEDTVIHEYAHIMNDQLTGAINGIKGVNKKMLDADGQLNEMAKELNKEAYRNYIQAKSNGDIYKVSCYASTDKAEFFAETFLMYFKTDPELPSYMVEFFDRYFTLTK